MTFRDPPPVTPVRFHALRFHTIPEIASSWGPCAQTQEPMEDTFTLRRQLFICDYFIACIHQQTTGPKTIHLYLSHRVIDFHILFIVDSASFSQAISLVFTITDFPTCFLRNVIVPVAVASGHRALLSLYGGQVL